MNLHTNITENHGEIIGQIGWKYYNTIKKKAMEQEFSLTGLFLSLSIAFFIVIISALMLSLAFQSLQSSSISQEFNNSIYRLEATSDNAHQYINSEFINTDRLISQRMSESV